MKKISFEQSKKYRTLGLLFALLAVTYRAIFTDIWGAIIILAISLYCDFQYKCPYCNKTLDLWANPESLEYCPRCGKKLNTSHDL